MTDRHPLKGIFSRTTGIVSIRKVKLIWILIKQETMGWQRHQLDHMQIICTSLQTHNHTSTSSLNFLQVGCSSWRPTNSIKAISDNSVKNHYSVSWMATARWPIEKLQVFWLLHQRPGRDHQGIPVARGWTPSSVICEPTTLYWMKQSTWPRTVLCGGWCLRMALRTPSGACQRRRRRIV